MKNLALQASGQHHQRIAAAKFKVLDQKSVQLNNLIAVRDTEIGVTLGRMDGYVKFSTIRSELYRGDYINFTLNGYKGQLYFNQELINLLLADLNYNLPFYDMPPEMQQAVLTATIMRILKSAGSVSNELAFSVDSYTLNESANSGKAKVNLGGSLKFTVNVSTRSSSIDCGLLFDEDAYPLLNGFFSGCEAVALSELPRLIDLPIDASLVAGRQTLCYQELYALEQNDIIVIETPDPDSLILSVANCVDYLVKRVAADSGDHTGAGSKNRFKIIKEFEERLMEDHADGRSSEEGGFFAESPISQGGGEYARGPNAAQIPVNLVFELGRKQLSFEDVQRLEEGYTFDLATNPQNAVDIIANGMKIGEAEIVEIAGRLGARVVAIKK